MHRVELHHITDLDPLAAPVGLGDEHRVADDLEGRQHRGAHGRHGGIAEFLDEVEDEACFDHGAGEAERVPDIPAFEEVEGSEGHGISGSLFFPLPPFSFCNGGIGGFCLVVNIETERESSMSRFGTGYGYAGIT